VPAILFTILVFASLGFVVSAIGALMGRNDVQKRRRWNRRMLLSFGVVVVVLAIFLMGSG
jgi:threonine/homoserine/homoserine lactone efflux protein